MTDQSTPQDTAAPRRVADEEVVAFRARVLGEADDFLAGRLTPSRLGFWAGDDDRRVARWARRHPRPWLEELLAVEPLSSFADFLAFSHSGFGAAVAAIGPQHAAYVEAHRTRLARMVVFLGIAASNMAREDPDYSDAHEVLGIMLSNHSILRHALGLIMHGRPLDPTPSLEEAVGHSLRPRQRALDRAFRAAVRWAWTSTGQTAPLPPVSLRGFALSNILGRWMPIAWPRAQLEIAADDIARSLEAVGHPLLEGYGEEAQGWAWDPCLAEAHAVATGLSTMPPAELVIHEVLHAADEWRVGRWRNDARGVPGILVTMGFARTWISAEWLAPRYRRQAAPTPWIFEASLYEGWTTARARILLPRLAATVPGLPTPADFGPFVGPDAEHPYGPAAALLRRLFDDEELLGLGAGALLAAFRERLRARVGDPRADAVDRLLSLQAPPIADLLPKGLRYDAFGDPSEEDNPLFPPLLEMLKEVDPTGTIRASSPWGVVMRWLDAAEAPARSRRRARAARPAAGPAARAQGS